MIKKISALFLVLVLCISMFVVPVSAVDTPAEGENTIVWELKWDKEYYQAGDTATLGVYVKGSPTTYFKTGAVLISFKSSQINSTDNPIADVRSNATTPGLDEIGNFWKSPTLTQTTWLTNATQLNKVAAANTATDDADYDTHLKYQMAWNSGGSHEGCTDGTLGVTGEELNALYDAGTPLITYTFKVAETAETGTTLSAKIVTGSILAGTQSIIKYMTAPGETTATASGSVSLDSCVAVTAKIGVEPCAPDAHIAGDAGVVTAPTCTEAGYTTYTCSVCNTVYTADETPATGHTNAAAVVENKVDPTCVATGSYESVVYCSVCNDEVSRETVTVEATGVHIPGEAVKENEKAASCSTDGSYDSVVYCTVCNAEISRTTEVVASTGDHVYATEVARKEASCTEAGSKTMQCQCGATQEVEIPATGHSHTAVVTAPNCTDAGYTTYTCACGDTYTADEVPATGHAYDAVVTAPTCTEAGYTTYTCANCSDVYTDNEVPATDHDYEGVVTTPATCTAEGVKTFTCGNCGDTYTEVIAILGHTEEILDAVAPTCTTTGLTEGKKCSVCGEVLVAQEVVDVVGHAYDEGVVTKEPTCTRTGVKTLTCAVCGDKVKEEIPAKGHTEEVVPGVAPTCTKAGSEPGSRCIVCSTYFAGKEIPATGHTKGEFVSTTAPTYLADGYSIYVCSVCGVEFKTDIVAKLVIDSSFAIVIQDPSVTELRAKDSLELHATMADGSAIAEGVTVVWTADDEGKFETEELDNGRDLKIISNKKGTVVFTATVYDANGKVIGSDTVEIYSNASFFQRIGGFFRSIFGTTKHYEF